MVAISTSPPTGNVPGVYAQILASPQNVGLVPSDIISLIFESCRGPFEQPLYFETITDFERTFGPAVLNPTNPNDLLSGHVAAEVVTEQQAQRKYGLRVGNALASTAWITLLSSTNAVLSLWAATPGTWANGTLVATPSAGVAANTWNLTVRNNATGEQDVILGLPGSDGSNPAGTAVNQAIAQINASSLLCTATLPVIPQATTAPTPTVTSSGGTLAAGTYYMVVTYTTATGSESLACPETLALTLSAPGHISVTLSSATGATGIKVYMTAAGGAPGTEVFAGAAPAALTLDIIAPPAVSTLRPPVGPSQVFPTTVTMATKASAAALPDVVSPTSFPTTGTAPAAGAAPGNDGVGAVSALYTEAMGALVGVQPHPNFVVPCGSVASDTAQWGAWAQLGADNDWMTLVNFPIGNTLAQAVTTMTGSPVTGIMATNNGQFLKVCWPWTSMQETQLLNKPLLIPPTYFNVGVTAVQPANTSSANKPLYNCIGPQYLMSKADKSTAITNNINALTNTVVRTSSGLPAWGFLNDQTVQGRDAYEVRMQSLVLEAFEALSGKYVGMPNSTSVRDQVQLVFTSQLDAWAQQGLIPANPVSSTTATAVPTPTTTATTSKIGVSPTLSVAQAVSVSPAYVVVCNDSNNVINGVETSTLFVDVQLRLFPNIKQILIRAAIGPTVQVTLQS